MGWAPRPLSNLKSFKPTLGLVVARRYDQSGGFRVPASEIPNPKSEIAPKSNRDFHPHKKPALDPIPKIYSALQRVDVRL